MLLANTIPRAFLPVSETSPHSEQPTLAFNFEYKKREMVN
jgi:hypothetical protein